MPPKRKLNLPKVLEEELQSSNQDEWNKAHNFKKYGKNRKQLRKEARQERKDRRHPKKSNQSRDRVQPGNRPLPSGSGENDEVDDNLTEDQTWAALKALKNKKNKKSEEPATSDNESVDEDLTEDQTWAALKALKDKKNRNNKRFNNTRETEKPSKKPKHQEPPTPFDAAAAKDEADAKHYAKMLGLRSLKLPKADDGLDELLGDLDFDKFSESESSDFAHDSDTETRVTSYKGKNNRNHDSPPVNAHDRAVIDKDEADARYYAKKLGLKNLKLQGTDDGLGDLLGDLDYSDFDKFDGGKLDERDSDSKSGSSNSDNESEPFIENPWGKDDTLSESDFDSDTESSGDELSINDTMKKLANTKLKSTHNEDGRSKDDDESDGSEPFIENPWGKDDTLSESDFDSEWSLSDESSASETMQKLKTAKKSVESEPEQVNSDARAADGDSDSEPFIENPWSDDSLSEGDFDSEVDLDDEDMSADQVMQKLRKQKQLSISNSERESADDSDDESTDESLDEDMDEDETWAALKALKAKKSGSVSMEEPEKPSEVQSENPYLPGGGKKYVPPAKRRLLEAQNDESEETQRIRRQLKGGLNKLSETNMGAIINEIESIFQNNSKQIVGSILTKIIMESVVSQGTLQESFLTVHAALVAALYKTIGVNFGAQFLQDVVQEFFKYYNPQERSRDASNLLQLITECYSLHMISSRLIYDLIKRFLADLTEVNTELLLLALRSSGAQLRSDDSQTLKDIALQVQTKFGSMEGLSVRTKVLIESIVALKNNRQKPQNQLSVALQQRVRKFLGSIKGEVSEPLQVSLQDIEDIDTKGKWWIVGAAYKGVSETKPETVEDFDAEEVDTFLASEPNWLELARKQRLNTDIRRAIFVALMGAEDYIDACVRIDKLRLKSKQEREIPHVILHSLVNEKLYNPYYALVAGKECNKHSMRKTFQFSLWDYLNQLENESSGVSLQKTVHYARFYASLVAQGSLRLDLLKVIDFVMGNEDIQIFLEVFFVFLYRALGKEAEKGGHRDGNNLVRILRETKDPAILRGIKYFQPRLLRSAAFKDCKPKDADRVKWASDMASEAIDQMDLAMNID